MIEVPIPQDIREFETTFVGPFTLRHCVCIAGIAGITYAGYFIEKAAGLNPMDIPIFALPALPLGLVGWFKPYGMHFEKFIGKAIDENFTTPAKRLYIVENTWDEIVKEQEEENRSNERKRARAEGKTYKAERKKQFKESPRGKLPQELRPYK